MPNGLAIWEWMSDADVLKVESLKNAQSAVPVRPG